MNTASTLDPQPTLDEARETMFWWHVADEGSKSGRKQLVRGTMGEAPSEFLEWWRTQCARNARLPFDPQHDRWVREQALCALVLESRGKAA